ncbi:hypothetical protein [Algisphaera agarilytica]|uniref:PEP-CTERM protein-sorting domain-containing protein n=1 Tax=Algisphaera agarilytica TaxID=1385975 RepID=A0A7X0LKS1_9BACT|nr:hypothetical protein [Algisphaera agarilytica]MBB6430232.1 hypothetical protein [Algisphaera agarilytica]
MFRTIAPQTSARARWTAAACAAVLLPVTGYALPAATGFETLPGGTTAVPVSTFNSDGIDITVSPMHLPGGGFTSNFAEVQSRVFIPPASGFGDGDQELELNNVLATFDFGGSPTLMQFDYAFYGGVSNLQVNGAVDAVNGGLSQILGVALGAALSTTNGTYNGVDFELTGQSLGGSNEIGRLTLGDGVTPINLFSVGGQEFAVDSFRAVPEPAGALALGGLGSVLLARRRGRETA